MVFLCWKQTTYLDVLRQTWGTQTMLSASLWEGACFSKDPITYQACYRETLLGPLSANFIGPEVLFLKAPVNSHGNYRARKNEGPLPVSHVRLALVHRRWSTTWHDNLNKLHFIQFHAADGFDGGGLFSCFVNDSAIRSNLIFSVFRCVKVEHPREISNLYHHAAWKWRSLAFLRDLPIFILVNKIFFLSVQYPHTKHG